MLELVSSSPSVVSTLTLALVARRVSLSIERRVEGTVYIRLRVASRVLSLPVPYLSKTCGQHPRTLPTPVALAWSMCDANEVSETQGPGRKRDLPGLVLFAAGRYCDVSKRASFLLCPPLPLLCFPSPAAARQPRLPLYFFYYSEPANSQQLALNPFRVVPSSHVKRSLQPRRRRRSSVPKSPKTSILRRPISSSVFSRSHPLPTCRRLCCASITRAWICSTWTRHSTVSSTIPRSRRRRRHPRLLRVVSALRRTRTLISNSRL